MSSLFTAVGDQSKKNPELLKRKGLFRYQVFLYRAFILEQSSLGEMKGI